ncbi:MAG: hypothetical protein ACLS7Z_01315 [Christensenellales bacterium]
MRHSRDEDRDHVYGDDGHSLRDYAAGRFVRQAEADEYERKRQACAGLGHARSGIAAAKLLLSLGAR